VYTAGFVEAFENAYAPSRRFDRQLWLTRSWFEPDYAIRPCTDKLESAFCDQDMLSFCCVNPEMCGSLPEFGTCDPFWEVAAESGLTSRDAFRQLEHLHLDHLTLLRPDTSPRKGTLLFLA
jgi:hypothetical protein